MDSQQTNHSRPLIVTALLALFLIGVLASLLSAVSLSFPGSLLEPIWRLNPHARAGFDRLGVWSIPLMVGVCVACALTVVGLWRRSLWGYWLAIAMITLNLVGDTVSVVTAIEPRAAVGLPIAVVILCFLLRKRTRRYFIRAA